MSKSSVHSWMIQASKPLTVRLPLNWFLIGHSWPLFSLSLSFQQLTVNNFFIFADDWIRSAYLWYQNRPLCLLSSNTAKAVKCNLTGFCPMRNCSLKIQAKFNYQDTSIAYQIKQRRMGSCSAAAVHSYPYSCMILSNK